MSEYLLLLPNDAASAEIANAAENMAADWLLLSSGDAPNAPRMRFYDWSPPAWTFGYGQNWTSVREKVGPTDTLIRRPTGGGLVYHRGGLTYALVLPPTHPWAKARACESYRAVHEALTLALEIHGVKTRLQGADCATPAKKLSVCFEEPATFDVLRADTGQKIAGAAQKRTRHGLLLQGSASPEAAPEIKDWNHGLAGIFVDKLSEVMNAQTDAWMKPVWSEEEFKETTALYASKEWNEKR